MAKKKKNNDYTEYKFIYLKSQTTYRSVRRSSANNSSQVTTTMMRKKNNFKNSLRTSAPKVIKYTL